MFIINVWTQQRYKSLFFSVNYFLNMPTSVCGGNENKEDLSPPLSTYTSPKVHKISNFG